MRADDEVVTAAKRGDAAAWRELYRAHAGRLLLWLEARTSAGGAAPEDLAAAAWLVAAERVADFTGTTSDFGGWLFGIARKHAANASRKHATRIRGLSSVETHATAAAPGPEPALIADEWVRQALQALPERERDVIACSELLDLDVATTASVLDITAVAVRVARHRGLKRLRGILENPSPEGTR